MVVYLQFTVRYLLLQRKESFSNVILVACSWLVFSEHCVLLWTYYIVAGMGFGVVGLEQLGAPAYLAYEKKFWSSSKQAVNPGPMHTWHRVLIVTTLLWVCTCQEEVMLGCLSRMARPTISNGSEGNIIIAQFYSAETKIPLENAAEIILSYPI